VKTFFSWIGFALLVVSVLFWVSVFVGRGLYPSSWVSTPDTSAPAPDQVTVVPQPEQLPSGDAQAQTDQTAETVPPEVTIEWKFAPQGSLTPKKTDVSVVIDGTETHIGTFAGVCAEMELGERHTGALAGATCGAGSTGVELLLMATDTGYAIEKGKLGVATIDSADPKTQFTELMPI
jgi:hypothetical protein